MEPQSREPALHLPQPVSEQLVPGAAPEYMPVTPEAQPSIAQGAPVMPAPQPQSMQPVQLPPTQAQPLSPLTTQATTTVAASTDEEIDRMWVNKAKKIVEQTRHDPFLESQEIGKVKVEYLKTRYNKDIKVAESKS